MAAIEAAQLRNVGLLGHRGAGKTSLGEAMLFAAGRTNRLGRVEDGTSAFDHEPEEINRQVSISTAFHSSNGRRARVSWWIRPVSPPSCRRRFIRWRGFGGAVFVLHAGAGLRVETERLWGYAAERGMPRILFVNRMDREETDPVEAVDAIAGTWGSRGSTCSSPWATARASAGSST